MRRAFFPLALVVFLAGCAAFEDASRTNDRQPPIGDRSLAAIPPEPEILDRSAETEQPEDRQARAFLPPAPRQKPAFMDFDRESFVGLTEREVTKRLGAPNVVQEESPATIWVYLVGDCRLELYFYFDLGSEENRTLTYELAPGAETTGAEAICIGRLTRAASAGGTI